MKNLRLLVGLTTLGFLVAVGCGDDSNNNSVTPGAAGDSTGATSNSGGAPSTAGSKNTAGTVSNPEGGVPAMGQAGSPTNAGMPGAAGAPGGAGPVGPGCGDGPLCDDATQQCVDGACVLIDGQACGANADCVHTCIGNTCATRSDVLEACDFAAGGAGSGGAGGAGGAGGEGGTPSFGGAPPEEMGNGDDADCLDGLACDSGVCKRKAGTDCTGKEQCLSNICHKSKCTPVYPGTCVANACAAPANNVCGLTTTMTNACSFNYIPNSACTADIKLTTCFESCACELAP